jgi:flagellar hook-associated protein 3 FlgL
MTYFGRVPSIAGGQLMTANLQSAYKRLIQLQDQMSSGKVIRVPSDDPAGTSVAMDVRTQLRRSQQFERNSSDAQSWLNTADSALVTSQDYLNRVRDLSIQARSGAFDPKAAAAVAGEIDQIRDSLIQLGNTRYGTRAIFAGTGNTTTPVQAGGQPDPLANAAAVSRPVAPGVSVQINTDTTSLYGAYVGTAGGDYTGNTFEVLTKLANDIRNPGAPGANLSSGQVALDAARDRMATVQAQLGARSNRVADLIARNAQVSQDLTTSLSDVEDVDIAKAAVDVQAQSMAYQAALAVTAKVIQPSLVDFLK